MKPHPFLDPARFWPNSFYLVLLSVVGAALLELSKGIVKNNPVASVGIAALISMALSFGIWIGCRREFKTWRERLPLTKLQIQPRNAAVSQGLIALCGPSAPDKRLLNPAYEAACYHKPALKYLWLITSFSGKETAEWVNQQVANWGVTTHAPIVLDDTYGIDTIKIEVESARNKALLCVKDAELVCDFTGMTKPVTAGMILACAPKGCRLEYLRGQYDSQGRLVPGASPIPVEIDIEYQIAPDI